ncbi:4Fe-4S dicluster domain-containing protein [Desulfitobacterium chlororespirans]|uniref:Prokaryotic molybdopterin-containing oxidoreductase family, iron-sulfur binding subunit n=1 Tax=Desulfitobacterium chlororespirans DSM 11544 TaxID=1121395 RepID=A0A1M7UCS3_9FIRM|nr:4Fe-4S dicluster domain-containing protein [Desulfitobacterium chlororespirans]SHN80744.1 prokaryotic molybdopterin-containing oxidoreductase family, iron-sulfur binding subunit [Desulfitobacterium chlororespirans DSM 11544]
MRYAMAIDLKRCIGCHTCAVACKMANNLPNEIWWNRILTVGGEAMDTAAGTFPNNTLEYLPVNCQHCANPACVKACPVGATYKREEDGIVIQDYDQCIGCRYCMVACPYSGVRQFNWKKPEYHVDFAVGDANTTPHQYNTVSKCTFCVHRLAEGKKPACMELCIGRARYFGDIDDPESDVSKAIKGRSYLHLLEEKGTKPNVYYLT